MAKHKDLDINTIKSEVEAQSELPITNSEEEMEGFGPDENTKSVKLDADLADYFENAEAVNKALRMLVEATRLVKSPAAKKAEAPAVAPETAEAVFSDMDFEDDVEAESYGQALEEAEAAETAENVEAEQSGEAAEKPAE